MAGYVARSGPGGTVSGQLHPLEVGAVAVEGDSGLAVLVVADLLQVDDDVATEARRAVAAAVGTTPDLVWLTATHTHSGPVPGELRAQTVDLGRRRGPVGPRGRRARGGDAASRRPGRRRWSAHG